MWILRGSLWVYILTNILKESSRSWSEGHILRNSLKKGGHKVSNISQGSSHPSGPCILYQSRITWAMHALALTTLAKKADTQLTQMWFFLYRSPSGPSCLRLQNSAPRQLYNKKQTQEPQEVHTLGQTSGIVHAPQLQGRPSLSHDSGSKFILGKKQYRLQSALAHSNKRLSAVGSHSPNRYPMKR